MIKFVSRGFFSLAKSLLGMNGKDIYCSLHWYKCGYVDCGRNVSAMIEDMFCSVLLSFLIVDNLTPLTYSLVIFIDISHTLMNCSLSLELFLFMMNCFQFPTNKIN